MDAYNDDKWEEDFEEDVSTANNLGVESTPSIYIDGELFKRKYGRVYGSSGRSELR